MSAERIISIENKLDYLISLLENKNKTISNETKTARSKRTKKKEEEKIIVKTGKCNLLVYKDAILITGNTFDRKELIKSMGGRWNSDNKGWTLNINKLPNVKNMLENNFETVEYIKDNEKTYLLKENIVESDECNIESDTESESE